MPRHELQKRLIGAVNNENYQEVEQLLRQGTDINDTSVVSSTPLHHAMFQGRWNMVPFLIEKGANVNIMRTDTVQSVLAAAIEHGAPVHTVRSVLLAGANI